jgi:uncharacterized protein YycO
MSIINIDHIQVGATLFVGGYTPTSWAIRKWQGYKYSHVAMYIGNGKIVEADVGGVQVNSVCQYIDSMFYYGEVVVPRRLSESALAHAVVVVLGRVKDGYDYPLMLGNVISRLWHRSRKKLGLYDIRNAWLCSELLAYGYQEAGLSLGSLTPNQVTPKNLYPILKER